MRQCHLARLWFRSISSRIAPGSLLVVHGSLYGPFVSLTLKLCSMRAVLFIQGVQVDTHTAALELQGVRSSVKADQPASFQSFIEMNDLTPGRHTLSESFYGSNGKLLQTYRDQVIANQLAPYNNYDIRNWHVVPTKGSNFPFDPMQTFIPVTGFSTHYYRSKPQTCKMALAHLSQLQ